MWNTLEQDEILFISLIIIHHFQWWSTRNGKGLCRHLFFGPVCFCVCLNVRKQLRALCLNFRSHGQSKGGPQGEEGMGEGTDAQQTRRLPLPFHVPLPAMNNKLFHSGIFAASRPQTLEAPTRSRCLIQCSEKNSWLESDFFYLVPFPYLPPRNFTPLVFLISQSFPLMSQLPLTVNTMEQNTGQSNLSSGLHIQGFCDGYE